MSCTPEDGHTGVSYEIIASREFSMFGDDEKMAAAVVRNRHGQRYLVMHVDAYNEWETPLFQHLGFRPFDSCPIFGECIYLILASTYKIEDHKFDALVQNVGGRLERFAALFERGLAELGTAWEAWQKLSGLIEDAGGEKLPSLIEVLKILPEYRELKKQAEEIRKRGKDTSYI